MSFHRQVLTPLLQVDKEAAIISEALPLGICLGPILSFPVEFLVVILEFVGDIQFDRLVGFGGEENLLDKLKDRPHLGGWLPLFGA